MIAHEPVPSATPDEPESVLHVTCVTLSVAVPRNATVAVPVVHCESAVGKVRLSFGSGSGRATVRTVFVMSSLTDTAVTVMVVVPGLIESAGMVQRDVPVATPLSPWSVIHSTARMPDAWLARPERAIDGAVVLNRAPAVGAVMRTIGGAAGASSFGCCCAWSSAGADLGCGVGDDGGCGRSRKA